MTTSDDYQRPFAEWSSTDKGGLKRAINSLSAASDTGLREYDRKRALALAFKILAGKWSNGDRLDLTFRGEQTTLKNKEDFFLAYRVFIYQWYTVCLSPDQDVDYYFQTHKLDLDQEKCIEQLIRDDDRLDPFFRSPITGNIDDTGRRHLQKLVNWHIRRYDLLTAWWLIRRLEQETAVATPEGSGVGGEDDRGVTTGGRGWWLRGVVLGVLLLGALSPFMVSRCSYSVIIVAFSAYAVGQLSLILVGKYSPLRLRLCVPRMMGCIFVGYLPLLLTSEVWQWVQYLCAPLAGQTVVPLIYPLVGLGFVLSFGYLLLEINNTVLDWRETWGRAFNLYLVGMFWSLMIGLISLDLLGLPLRKTATDVQRIASEARKLSTDVAVSKLGDLTWVPGFWGQIPVEMLLLFAPLALLIGIFVQVIWEEKPITHPI